MIIFWMAERNHHRSDGNACLSITSNLVSSCREQGGTLAVMIAEAIVVLARQTTHFRVTRALRPLFLLDCYYCRGVRRYNLFSRASEVLSFVVSFCCLTVRLFFPQNFWLGFFFRFIRQIIQSLPPILDMLLLLLFFMLIFSILGE